MSISKFWFFLFISFAVITNGLYADFTDIDQLEPLDATEQLDAHSSESETLAGLIAANPDFKVVCVDVPVEEQGVSCSNMDEDICNQMQESLIETEETQSELDQDCFLVSKDGEKQKLGEDVIAALEDLDYDIETDNNNFEVPEDSEDVLEDYDDFIARYGLQGLLPDQIDPGTFQDMQVNDRLASLLQGQGIDFGSDDYTKLIHSMNGNKDFGQSSGKELQNPQSISPGSQAYQDLLKNLGSGNAGGDLGIVRPDGSPAGLDVALPQQPQGIIVHSSTVNTHLNGAYNGGYRYNFGIDRNGVIWKLKDDRASHIKGPGMSQRQRATVRDLSLSNSNTIAISLLDTDNDRDGRNRYDSSIPHKTVPASQAQLASFQKLHSALVSRYPSIRNTYGHGQIQTDRHHLEGLDAVQSVDFIA